MHTTSHELATRLAKLGPSITPEHVEVAGGHRALVALLHEHKATAARAAYALLSLTSGHATSRAAVREADGIPPLVALLAGGEGSAAAEYSAGALASLAADTTNQIAVREAGGIPPLVALLAAGPDSEASMWAAGAL